MVYDAGMDSAANQQVIETAGCTSSARWCRPTIPTCSPCPPAATPSSTRTASPASPRSRHAPTALGAERRVVVTHSQSFHDAQARGFAQTLAKATRRLGELAERLARGKTRRNRAAVQADIAEILRPRWLDRVLTVELTGQRPAELRLTWRTRHHQPAPPRRRDLRQTYPVHRPRRLARRRGHRRLPLPSRRRSRLPPDERPPRRVVQPDVPLDRLQDPGPRLLLRRSPSPSPTSCAAKPPRAGIHMSVRELLATLAGIQETVLLYQGDTRPTPRPPHAHRHRPHPTSTPPPLRPRHLRPHPLNLGNTQHTRRHPR